MYYSCNTQIQLKQTLILVVVGFQGCLAVFLRFFFLMFHQSLRPAEDSCPLKMLARETGETLERKTLRTWPNNSENLEQPLDPGRESLQENFHIYTAGELKTD